MTYEKFLIALVEAHREYENVRRVLGNPPVASTHALAYRDKHMPRLHAAQKVIDDLVLKRATEIRKERKALKSNERDGAQNEG